MYNNERLDRAEIVQVIKTTLCKGAGTQDDPARIVVRYYDLDGSFIGETTEHHARGTLAASSANHLL